MFARGTLQAVAAGADDLLVITRQWQQQVLLLAVRLRPSPDSDDPEPAGLACADDPRTLPLPGVPVGRYRNLLESQPWTHTGTAVPADTLFNDSPLAIWIRDVEQQDGA